MTQHFDYSPSAIKVLSHQHRWLAGDYDLKVRHFIRFLEVSSMVVTWLFCAVDTQMCYVHAVPATNYSVPHSLYPRLTCYTLKFNLFKAWHTYLKWICMSTYRPLQCAHLIARLGRIIVSISILWQVVSSLSLPRVVIWQATFGLYFFL